MNNPYREPMPPCKECDVLTAKLASAKFDVNKLQNNLKWSNQTIEDMKGTRMLSSRAYISFAIVALCILLPIFVGKQFGTDGFSFITMLVLSGLAAVHEIIVGIKRC
jgi:hypothetical protein